MKLILPLLFAGCLALSAETEEQINKRFPVQPGGRLVVDVDFGSIDVNTNGKGHVGWGMSRRAIITSRSFRIGFFEGER